MSNKADSAQASNRQVPEAGDNSVPQIAGVMLFDDDAPEVRPQESKRKGKAPAPGNAIVMATLDALVAAKVAAQPGEKAKAGRYAGTNATVRSDLKRTVKMWEKAQSLKGITVKVSYTTLDGTISPLAEKNDEEVSVKYVIDSLDMPAANTDQAETETENKADELVTA